LTIKLSAVPRDIVGIDLRGMDFCGYECRVDYAAGAKNLQAQQARKAQQAHKAEQARKAKEARKKKEQTIADKRRPFDHAIASDPLDAAGYVRLADSLLEAAGIQKDLRKIQEIEPMSLGGLLHNFQGVVSVSMLLPRSGASHGKFARKLEQEKPLLVEAREAYFKAIALGTEVDSYASACHKLAYVFISFLALADQQYWTLRDEASYYAREAEKELRKHLRKKPDDIAALQKMALAIAIYQENDRTRSQRLASVNARIKEAETRLQLDKRPPHGLNPPGSPDSLYPDNWADIREAVKGRDSHGCTRCGAVDVELHVHHIVPLSKGGGNDFGNLVTLCDICHKEDHSSG